MNIFNKMHYKSKLILCYLALISIPLAFLVVLLYNSIITPVHDSAIQAIQNRMDQELYAINSEMDKLNTTSYLLSTNTTINRFLQPVQASDLDIIHTMNNDIFPLLSWVESSNSDIYEYHFFTFNSSIPETRFFHQYPQHQEEDWMQQMQSAIPVYGHYWEPIHPMRCYGYDTAMSPPAVYSLFYPLLSSGNYLEVCIPPSVFFDSFDASPILDSGFLLAASSDGTIVSGDVPSSLAGSLKPFLHEKFVQDISSVYSGTINRERYFICHRPVTELDTWLVSLVPYSDISAPLEQARLYFSAAILATTVGVIFLSWLLATLLIRRINKMTESVHQIQEGNFQINLLVKGNDEIDQLGTAINYMAYKINDLINRVYKAEVLQKETELAALQAQINPHFLFNILDTFKMIAIIHDLDDFSDSIAALGSLMRYNISSSGSFFPLRRELKILQDYIRIQNLLLNDRVRLYSFIPDELLDFEIPNFVLQPIAENAFVHGFKNKSDQLILRITALLHGEQIELRIEDNGSGIDKERQEELECSIKGSAKSVTSIAKGESIGLANVYARLTLHYQDAVSIGFCTSDLGGACITLILPCSYRTPAEENIPPYREEIPEHDIINS